MSMAGWDSYVCDTQNKKKKKKRAEKSQPKMFVQCRMATANELWGERLHFSTQERESCWNDTICQETKAIVI